jgi:hypothetical protein
MSEKEVLIIRGQGDGQDGWSPDIVVGVDFGMTYTGRSALYRLRATQRLQLCHLLD